MAIGRMSKGGRGVAAVCILALIASTAGTASATEADSGTPGPALERVVDSGGEVTLVFDDGSVAEIGDARGLPDAAASAALISSHDAGRATVRDRSIDGRIAGVVAGVTSPGEPDDLHLACTSHIGRSRRIGLTLMPAVDWTDLEDLVVPVTAGTIGGVVVLGEPDASIAATLGALRAAAPEGFLAAVDEEGGRVQRLRRVLGALPSARLQASGSTAADVAALLDQHGREVRGLGFDVALAPVLDVGGGPGIGDRAYGDTTDDVVEFGLAAAQGLASAGLVPVVKHFPGHGRASVDSHIALPVTPSIEELAAVDLEPFRRAIEDGVPAIMVGHLDVPGLTDGVPASLSRAAVSGLLRDEMGFSGLVMTDALNMGAIVDEWTTPEAVELALVAGADVMILGDASEITTVHDRVVDAIANGRLDPARLDAAAANVMRVSGTHACRAAARN